jgi:hypothetical protein
MYPCPVCGHLTFVEPPGSYDMCEVCGWEDDALQLEFATTLAGGANGVTLAAAQAAFLKVETRMTRKHAGAVFPCEREPSWRPIDPICDHFPNWDDSEPVRATIPDERLYYWRETFWNRERAS